MSLICFSQNVLSHSGMASSFSEAGLTHSEETLRAGDGEQGTLVAPFISAQQKVR